MPERRDIYHNQDGVRRTAITDSEHPDRLVVQTEVVMDQALKNNHELRELHPRRSVNKMVARAVPLTVYERSIHEGWGEDDWKKWLNSDEAIPYRIWQGRV